MKMTPEQEARLLIKSVQDALANGIRHFDKTGVPLYTAEAVIAALVRDGEVILQDSDARSAYPGHKSVPLRGPDH